MSPDASSLTVGNNISILLKGPFGFGKTIAACSMAVKGPIWLAYWDKKAPIELLAFFKKHNPAVLENIEYDVYGAKNANEFLNKLYKVQKDCRYYGIVNDSITMMTAAAVGWSLGFRNPRGPKIDALNPAAYQLIPDFDEYKVETSLVVQSLDICKSLPCNVIWTCHPVPSIKVEQAGTTMKVTKVNQIVSYGSKVAGIAPGQFSEIYHLSMSNSWDSVKAKSVQKRVVHTVGVDDEFAKTALNLPEEMDITDKLFWPVFQEALQKGME
jgi:hypothetical protein